MKPKREIHDPYHNPFHNRFHVPVHARLDEMQSCTHMVWLHEQAALDRETEHNQHARHWGRALAAAFALAMIVVFSATLLSN